LLLRVSDPSHVEGNVVFAYFDIFDHGAEALAELKDHDLGAADC
jgi:tryptophanyl-tRNA synthetase